VEVGITFPQHELAGDPEGVGEFCDTVESLGFRHLLAFDHVLGAEHRDRVPPLWGPYDENDPFHDPIALFSFLAGRTCRIKFVTGVLVLPQRQTALVARQAADLAILSGNRLRLGVGIGWNQVEYLALGQKFESRAARLEEQIELLRRLWTQKVVTFVGEFDTVDRAGCIPRPGSSIPIWLGGWADRALKRAARVGDGFIFAGDPDRVQGGWWRMKSFLAEEGRSLARFGADAVLPTFTDPGEAADFIGQWAEAGGSHVTLSTNRPGLASVQAHVEYLAELAEALRRPGWLPADEAPPTEPSHQGEG